jgi:hypothetical protein
MRSTTTDKWWKTSGVAGRLFRTKADLENHIRAIVAKYPLEVYMDGEDVAFMTEVFKHHYRWDDKRGPGVAGMFTRRVYSATGASTGIMLKRIDGSEVDISWVVCLMPGGRPKAKRNLSVAARYEVMPQRNAASHAVPHGAACPLCGQPLLAGDRHVDHAPPHTFEGLLDFWLIEEGLNYEQVEIEDVGVADAQFIDRELAARWQDFHRQHAVLRVIHIHENLRRAA